MGRNLGPLNIKDSYEGLVQISGSDQLTDGSGSVITSLDVTASFASQAGTSGFASTATSASYATTASFALNAGASTLQEVLDNSNEATQDIILTGSYQRVSGSFSGTVIDNITDTFTSTEKIQHVITLTQAEYNAITPEDDTFYVITDAEAAMITGSVADATLTFTKDDASTFDLVVDNVANATSASNAITAQTASFLPADTNLNINSITASNASFTSASIGYLQTITGSAKIIGDAFIILNNNLPTERYAGIVVQDSGSGSPLTTSSLQYDGQTDDWFYEYSNDGGVTVDHGVTMFGPEYNTKGSPAYPTNNVIQKGDGGHHLLDSSITDDGTLVTINANVSASGYVSASSFIGDGSQLSGISTTPFPFTGSAEISGSLRVQSTTEGQIVTGHPNNIATGARAAVIGGGLAGADANEATGTESAVVGGHNNVASNTHSIVAGGKDNTNNGFYGGIIAGRSTTLTGQYGISVGGSYHNVSGQGAGVIAGTNHAVSGENAVIVGGNANGVSGIQSAVVAGGSNNNAGRYSVIVGGTGHAIAAGQDRNVLLGGQENDITSGDASGILAGYLNDIQATTAAVVGGRNNTAQHQDSVVLGGDGNSTSKTKEAVVEHLTANGQVKGAINVLTDAAGTTALDCSVGNYFTLAMPAGGSTVLTPSNITAGQTINIKITQNATAATLTYAASIDFPGGTAFTISTGSGEVDVLTLVSFDGTTLQATGLANFS